MVMIAQRFPEASFIFLHQANAAHPLRALPEIQMWHDHPRGSTMFRCEWSIIVLERNERLTIDDVRERHVGRAAFVFLEERQVGARNPPDGER